MSRYGCDRSRPIHEVLRRARPRSFLLRRLAPLLAGASLRAVLPSGCLSATLRPRSDAHDSPNRTWRGSAAGVLTRLTPAGARGLGCRAQHAPTGLSASLTPGRVWLSAGAGIIALAAEFYRTRPLTVTMTLRTVQADIASHPPPQVPPSLAVLRRRRNADLIDAPARCRQSGWLSPLASGRFSGTAFLRALPSAR